MNLQQRLNQILYLDTDYEKESKQVSVVSEQICSLLKFYANSGYIACAGNIDHILLLLHKIKSDIRPDYLIDINLDKDLTKKRKKKKVNGIPVIAPDELCNYNITAIISTSFSSNDRTISTLSDSTCHIISLKNEIEALGLLIPKSFVRFEQFYNSGYEYIMELRDQYESLQTSFLDSTTEEYLINSLIYAYLDIKDFVNAKDWMQRYISRAYRKSSLFKKMIVLLDQLFEDIRLELLNRGQKDIIMTWNDGLRYDEIAKMPYLSCFSNSGMFFENAYTTVYDTHGTLNTIMQRKLQIDGFGSFVTRMTYENTPLLTLIKDNGYDFRFLGSYESGFNTFADELCIIQAPLSCGSERYWSLLETLLQAQKPLFAIIHIIVETHNPYHSGWLLKDVYYDRNSDPVEYLNQIETSRSYWDSQLAFYSKLLPSKTVKIMMSDHGKPLTLHDLCVLQWTFKEEYTHVALLIQGDGLENASYNQMFSYYHFYELLQYILAPTKENLLKIFEEDFVRLQSIDRYNEQDIKRKLSDHTNKKCMMAYRAIRTEKELYVRLANGEEAYILLDNPEINLLEQLDAAIINPFPYSKRINNLRSLAGDFFLDIYKLDKFKYSRMLYED